MEDTLGLSDAHGMLPTPLEVIEAHLAWMKGEGGFSRNTVEDAERLLLKAHRELPGHLVKSDRDEISTYLYRESWSAQTKATYRGHFRRFFVWATDEDDPWVSFDPTARLRRPKVRKGIPHPATDAEVRAAVNDLPMPFLIHARLAAYAGLRCIEVARQHREDMDEREIRVFGKGDKPAVLPQHPAIWSLVEHLPPGPVTRNTRGGPATDHWVSDRTAAHLRRIGVDATMHELRGWYITMIQRTYKDATVTQRLARHESLNTTQGYVLVADEACREAVAGLPDFTDR